MLKENREYEGNIYIDYRVALMREFPERRALVSDQQLRPAGHNDRRSLSLPMAV
jgi:hypothetical protein